MGRVIACGIPQGAELNRTPEYRREQVTKKARRKRPSGRPQGTEQKRRNTAECRTEPPEYRREQDKEKEKRMAEKEQNNKNGHTYRATWKDYSEPTIYLLTMNTEDRQPLLGELVGEKIVLSAYGKVVSEEIKRIPTYKDASAIQIYRYVVMPNHIHVLLRVHKKLPHPLGYYISWFKLQCMERTAGIPAGTGPQSDRYLGKNTTTGY